MIDDTAVLPTPLAQVVSRLQARGVDDSADCFLKASYVNEVMLKLIGLSLAAGLSAKAEDHAYRIRYELVRADGLGTWDRLIAEMASAPLSGFLDPSLLDLAAWITKKRTKPEDEWFVSVTESLGTMFQLLGLETSIPDRKPAVRHALAALVQLRNKTKAHGAVGEEFFSEANPHLVSASLALLEHCPLFKWRWLYLFERADGTVKAVWLGGMQPRHARAEEVVGLRPAEVGVHLWPPDPALPLPIGELLQSDREVRKFLFPNGSFTPTGEATFLDYWLGREEKVPVRSFQRLPASLPPSETEGRDSLIVHSNVFGNLPEPPIGYVSRLELERKLLERLRDLNHPVITLHGRGGVGKTSLALSAAYQLAQESEPVFEQIIWFSARDVDLALHGPRSVRPSVVELGEVARIYGGLFSADPSLEGFARTLREADSVSGKGTLFVFDNFETMRDPRAVQEFLDNYTHIPNKILITSRERAFKADFPIEVHGMSRVEADQLMNRVARDLSVPALIDEEARESIFTVAEGHPYVMKILVGEAAKEGRYAPPKTMLPKRFDILNAVFERSFNKLSPSARWVFLIIANWRSAVSEAGLLVLLAQRELDAEQGIEECARLSLIVRREFLDGHAAYTAPQVARFYARKKLEGDPDRLLIQEDLELIQRFGVVPTQEPIQVPRADVLSRFAEWCVEESTTDRTDGDTVRRLDLVLQDLGSLWPEAWMALARLREAVGSPSEDVEYALRRAVEENPGNKTAWLLRADYAKRMGDDTTFISARIRAVELDSRNVAFVREVAAELADYITRHSHEIPVARRGVYLASVRDQMTSLAGELDATGLSRLAWLYIQEGNEERAWHFASRGLKLDSQNEHCFRLIERLRNSGFEESDILSESGNETGSTNGPTPDN